jgi:cytochrome P450
VERRASDGGAGLVSSLCNSGNATKQEVVETCALLLVAGYETTASAIATSVHALISHPDQLEALRANADIARRAVHELLRYCGPMALGVSRYTRQEVVVAGTAIPAGQRVILGLGTANHDGGTFAQPDVLDPTWRSNSR